MIVFETFIGTRESAIIMPPFTQKLLALENPFRVFRVFRGSFDEFWYSKKENPLAKAKGYIATIFKLECQGFLPDQE